jgi:hypothetical protein
MARGLGSLMLLGLAAAVVASVLFDTLLNGVISEEESPESARSAG